MHWELIDWCVVISFTIVAFLVVYIVEPILHKKYKAPNFKLGISTGAVVAALIVLYQGLIK